MPLDRLTQVQTIIDHCDSWYHNGVIPPFLPDPEYNALKRELKALNPADERLTRVGAPVLPGPGIRKLKHRLLMGSLNNAMEEQAFLAWYEKMGQPITCNMPKMDGASLELVWEKRKLIKAITRGNKIEGQDVLCAAYRITDIPTVLPPEAPDYVEVRGEVILHKDKWAQADPGQETNERNVAAGILRRLDGEKAELLNFYAYRLLTPVAGVETQGQALVKLQEWGFRTVIFWTARTSQDVIDLHATVGQERAKYPFHMDGVVSMVDDLARFERLGMASDCPVGAVAFKWEEETAITQLTGLDITVGKTGMIAFTAQLKPVDLGGVSVKAAYLHNLANILTLDVGIKDTVKICRGGEVIPYVIEVVSKAADRTPITAPEKCPVCDGPVGRRKNVDESESVALYCLADDCPAQGMGRIGRWLKSLDILGWQGDLLETLYQTQFQDGLGQRHPLLQTIPDLYKMLGSYADAPFRRRALQDAKFGKGTVGEKRATKLLAGLEKTRKLTVSQFMGSLGIFWLGKDRAKLIRQAWQKTVPGKAFYLDIPLNWLTRDDFSAATKSFSPLKVFAAQLSLVNVGERLQNDLDANADLIRELLTFIEVVPDPEETVPGGGKLKGKSFCLTGTLSQGRKEVEAAIAEAGGVPKDDVTKALDYLVLGADPGSKLAKAQKHGITIIDEAKLQQLLAEGV